MMANEKDPNSMGELALRVNERIKSECTQVEWIHNLAIAGPYDYVDIFQAPDNATAFKVSTIVKVFGHAHAEVWPALEWKTFKELITGLSENEMARISFGEGVGDISPK